MLDLQNLQKSSADNKPEKIHPVDEVVVPEVHFDRNKAIAEFDRETKATRDARASRFRDAKVATLYANAQVLIKSGEISLAMNLLRTASNLDSKNVIILNSLSSCLERRGNFDEAIKVREVIARLDCNFETIQKLATLYYKLGQDEKAASKYYEALSMLVDESEAIFDVYKNLGNIYVRQGDFEAAEDHYNKAYTIDPECDSLLVNFGTLEVQRADFDKALFCFRQAININCKNDKAWVGLSMIHSQFGDHELAWGNLETAVDINPANRTAVHLLANWSLRDCRIDRGIVALEDYLGRVDFDEEMSLVLINLYCSVSQIEKAKLECEKVLLWNPDNQDVATLKAKLKRVKEA